MVRFRSRFLAWWLLAASLAVLTASGCTNLFTRAQSDDEEDEAETELKVDKVGDHVTVAGLHSQQIEGVGLVVNLDGTGGDPSPSLYRTMLIDDMRKHSVLQADKILADPSTALVLVRAVLPPAIQVGDRFDVEVIIPESANATSLAGGTLLMCSLAEQAIAPGRRLSSLELGKAQGPVMVTLAEDESKKSASLRRGKILSGGAFGGGLLKKDRPLELYLRSDFRSVRNAKRIADRIGRRFHSLQKGIKKPLAKATTDQHIELQIHPRYKQNFMRYVQVVRQITISEDSVEEHARLERLGKSLMVPQTASSSAMDLEAIGGDGAVAVLKKGLQSPDEEVRFYSADALAYLGSSAGARELALAAENEEAFRVFALAALSILDEGETNGQLRRLMNETSAVDPDEEDQGVQLASATAVTPEVVRAAVSQTPVRHGAETRYGAFKALKTLDRNDPFIRGEPINNQFLLHVLKTDGEPMVHLSRSRVQEIVLFGAEQELRRPVALTAGRHIQLNAPAGSERITLSRIETGKPDRTIEASPQVADVIRKIGELGGTYPDVAQMLTQAKRQANLEGRLEIDALPRAGRVYYRKSSDPKSKKPEETQVGTPDRAPNIFPAAGADDLSALDRLSRTPGEEKAPAEKSSSETESKAADLDEEAESESDESEASAPVQKPGFFSNLFRNPFGSSAQVEPQSEPE